MGIAGLNQGLTGQRLFRNSYRKTIKANINPADRDEALTGNQLLDWHFLARITTDPVTKEAKSLQKWMPGGNRSGKTGAKTVLWFANNLFEQTQPEEQDPPHWKSRPFMQILQQIYTQLPQADIGYFCYIIEYDFFACHTIIPNPQGHSLSVKELGARMWFAITSNGSLHKMPQNQRPALFYTQYKGSTAPPRIRAQPLPDWLTWGLGQWQEWYDSQLAAGLMSPTKPEAHVIDYDMLMASVTSEKPQVIPRTSARNEEKA
ncbi:hypothetical protein LTR66_013015 [Elasticomyces elasticus]|nr:hypothetical protein LTR66_013015 [Elasticomyces elasticus]